MVVTRKQCSIPCADSKRTCNRSLHTELCKRAERWLVNTMGCSFALRELTTIASEQPDAIGWKFGHESYLVECKTSRSDFKADAKKFFRRHPDRGMGCFRFMMCPPDLIQANELPEGWGLLYCYPKHIKKIVLSGEHTRDPLAEMSVLTSALRRIHGRGDLQQLLAPIHEREAA